MSQRELQIDKARVPDVEGFLGERIMAGQKPEYGYLSNHLPKVTDEERVVKSCLDIATASTQEQ